MRGLATLIILASALIVTPVYSQDSTQLKGPKGVDYGAQGRSIGPIKPTDTLWRIAAKVRPDNSVSIYQVMQALYNKNPDSFLEQNLNHIQNGAYLKIPTLAEIKAVNTQLAKQRSEQDDALWEKKKNGTLTQSETNSAQTKVTQARKIDVDDAKKEIQKELNEIKTEQGTKLVELQQQFKSSVSNVEDILVENNNLKKQLSGISKELENLRLQLGQDSEIQNQLKELIVKQNEIIAQQKKQEVIPKESFDFGSLFSNPIVLGLLMFIPGLLIIFAIVMFLRKRASNQEEPQNDDDFLPQTPTYTGDDDLGPSLNDDPIVPDPLDDLSVQLDDSLESDMLPNDDLDDGLDDFSGDENLLDQDELESLLSDDIVFDDENTDDDDELDIFMQQGFDQPSDENAEDIDLDLSDDSINNDEILTNDDLDSLFDEDDSLPEFDAPQTSEALEDDSLESHDEMAALSEELADDDNFDIDELLDQTSTELDTSDNTLDELDSSDDFDLDDIDNLIDEANEPKSDVVDDSIDAELLDENELLEENDNFDLDDIDSLIDEAAVDAADDSLVEESDDFDLDDIDSLIDEAVVDTANDSLVEESDDFDLDDIDSLIDETAVDTANDSLVEESDDFDLDDIDSLIDEAAVDTANDSLVEESDDFDLDDIDNLIDEAAVDAANDSLVEQSDGFDLDDIDNLIDDEVKNSDVRDSEIDNALADSVEDLADAQEELNVDDIESLASSLNEEPVLDNEPELAEEPEFEEEPELDDEPELAEEPELIDVTVDDFSDTSESLLDPEDALEEYTDDTLKSVDELLNELQQATDDDYIETPDWSLDELDDDLEEIEVDLGDDPLAGDDDSDLTKIEEQLDSDLITPSEELDEYPELELDDDHSLLENEPSFEPQEPKENAPREENAVALSQTEKDLANALSENANLDSLEDDFDDELLNDNDFSESEAKVEDESFDDDLLQEINDGIDSVEPVSIEEDTKPLNLDEVQETLESELPFTPEELQGDDLDGEAQGVASSQAEQDLSNALSENNDLDNLEDDFDDEILIEDDFSDLDVEFDEDTLEQALTDELSDEQQEQTNAEHEAQLTNSDEAGSTDISSDDELDEEFMSNLTQTDFDSLLSELAEPEGLSAEDSSEFDVDFDSLLKEDLEEDDSLTTKEPLVESSDIEQLDNDEFVDIDSLLEESEEAELEHEPYTDVNMDVGLSEFDALLAGDNPTDVDAESGGYSAKLDLARAYIEIDDFDSALKVIEDVINKGPEEVQEEALSLKAKLK
ncbi:MULTISPECIES: FimV/HubP family polar landmark protein [unclassified Pseudoalteromonas]|uniref:FimV/HubP family polar landmark protein n=1 Tax=unclassified Pseudoalteromonas TaxID=194690 RepID=UPI000409F478|nr:MULTISPECIES: FimV/HubP family polar landmark protein [unclassified Pseudoalteromonas]